MRYLLIVAYYLSNAYLLGEVYKEGILNEVSVFGRILSGGESNSTAFRFPRKSASIDEYGRSIPSFDDSKALELSPGHSRDRMTDMGTRPMHSIVQG